MGGCGVEWRDGIRYVPMSTNLRVVGEFDLLFADLFMEAGKHQQIVCVAPQPDLLEGVPTFCIVSVLKYSGRAVPPRCAERFL